MQRERKNAAGDSLGQTEKIRNYPGLIAGEHRSTPPKPGRNLIDDQEGAAVFREGRRRRVELTHDMLLPGVLQGEAAVYHQVEADAGHILPPGCIISESGRRRRLRASAAPGLLGRRRSYRSAHAGPEPRLVSAPSAEASSPSLRSAPTDSSCGSAV